MLIESSKDKHKQYEAEMQYWSGAFDEKHDDTKRHFEMLKTTLPIVKALNPITILTIGDNRGRDAAFFKKSITNCTSIASDLDISKLLPAKIDGFIDDCKIIDVEKIDYPESSIDIVVAKESFHHWPRPMLGFYEMLRVARLGVILIEPYDWHKGSGADPYISANNFNDQYEAVGNYKYQISLREILKACWSLYLDKVVACGFNDPYSVPFIFEEWLKRKKELDALGEIGTREFNLMTIFVEKELNSLDPNAINGFKIYTRPPNPFMAR
jgi:SAM-dependent methyltransferase